MGSATREDDLARVCAASAAYVVLLADPRVAPGPGAAGGSSGGGGSGPAGKGASAAGSVASGVASSMQVCRPSKPDVQFVGLATWDTGTCMAWLWDTAQLS